MNRLRNNTVENVKWIEVAGIALLFLLTPSIIGLPAIIYAEFNLQMQQNSD